MGEPEYLAADGQGNIWIGNYTSGAGTSNSTNSSILELSPAGIPLKQALVGAFGKPSSLILDPAGNVFVSDTLNGRTVEYTTAGTTSTFPTAAGTYSLASDGSGNVFVANKTTGTILKIPAGSASGTTPTTAATITTTYPAIAFDTNANLWVATGAAVSEFLYSNNYASASTSSTTGAYESLAIDPSNNAWSAIYGTTTGQLTKFAATNTTVGAGTSYGVNATGIYDNKQALSDSAGNIFLANSHTTTGGIVEYNNSGTLVSPAAGFGGHAYDYTYGETIDQAGNVWVGAGITSNAYILEIVGVAAPTIAPLAAQLPSTPAAPPTTTKTTLTFTPALPAAYEPQGGGFNYPATLAATNNTPTPAINPVTANGTFSLVYNGSPICSVSGPFTPGSVITCVVPSTATSVTSLPAGTYTVQAVYSGDSTYAASSTPINLVIQPSTTTTTTVSGAAFSGPAATGAAIVGGTVTLYATQPYGVAITSAAPAVAGDVGPGYYAGPASVLATTTTAANGTFTLPKFACSNVDDLYVTVSGGYVAGGGSTTSNPNTLLMAALGSCVTTAASINAGTLTPVINEVTTAAAAYTLSGFMSVSGTTVNITSSVNDYAASVNPTTGVATATMYHPAGLQHAFLNAANLANVSTGTAQTALYTSTGTAAYPVTTTSPFGVAVVGTAVPTLPTALLNSVGNVLAACVQASTTCTTPTTGILAMALPLTTGTATVPTNTLGAMLNIARNPYMGGAGYAAYWLGLASGGNSPYGTTTVITPSAPATVAGTTFTGNTAAKPHDLTAAIFYPTKLAGNNTYGVFSTLDANDNFYALAEVTATTPYYYVLNSQTSAGINQYSHQYCQVSVYSQTTVNGTSCPEQVLSPFSIAADQVGNLWMTLGGTTPTTTSFVATQAGIVQLNAATGAFSGNPASTATQESVYNAYEYASGLAIDQNNDVWYGVNSTTGAIFEYVYTAGTNTVANPAPFTVGVQTGAMAYSQHYSYQLQFDAQQNLFSSAYSSTASTNDVAVEPNQSLTSSAYPPLTTGTIASSYATHTATSTPFVATTGDYGYGVAVDAAGNVYESGAVSSTNPYTGDGLNVILRSGMTYTSNVISALPTPSLISGSPISATGTGLVNNQITRAEFLTQDGDGAIWDADTYADTVIRVYGPTGTSVLAYYPCVGATCYNFGSNYTSTTVGLYGAKFPLVDSTGTVTVLTSTQGQWAQIFGIGTPSFPLLQAGKPAQMP